MLCNLIFTEYKDLQIVVFEAICDFTKFLDLQNLLLPFTEQMY